MSAPKPIPIYRYRRFSLSFREVEDLLAERRIQVSYESIRQWCSKFGPEYAAKLFLRKLLKGQRSEPRRLVMVGNRFRVGRHLLRAANHRMLRSRAFVEWNAVTCA